MNRKRDLVAEGETAMVQDVMGLSVRVVALEDALRQNMEYCRDHCRGTGMRRGGNSSGRCTWKPCIEARKLVGSLDD